MARFCHGVLRRLAAGVVLTMLCLLPPEALSRGPNLCLWRRLLHLAACPACGTMHALAAFFHGRFGDALSYNRNVLVTGPLLVILAAKDVFYLVMNALTHGGKQQIEGS